MQATAELTPAQRRTLDGLIGTDERPVFAVDGVLRVRDRIEEAARAFEPPEPLWLGKPNAPMGIPAGPFSRRLPLRRDVNPG
jgi:hypothetical protein